MTARQLEAVSYAVLLIGLAMTWWTLLTDVGHPTDLEMAAPLLWLAAPYGLAAGASRWRRSSRRAQGALLALWCLMVGVTVWLLPNAFVWNANDMAGMVLFSLPVAQIPVILLATLIGWGLHRGEA